MVRPAPPTLDPRPKRRLDRGMKAILFALFVALLMVGCGEDAQKNAVQEDAKDDPRVPLLIPCEACHKGVSKKTEGKSSKPRPSRL